MISADMPPPTRDLPRANVPVNAGYERATILWMVLMASIGLGMWVWLFGGVKGTGAVISDAPRAPADDAEAVISRFGTPEDDRLDGPDTVDAPNTRRTLSYMSRHLRIVFVRRELGSPPRRM